MRGIRRKSVGRYSGKATEKGSRTRRLNLVREREEESTGLEKLKEGKRGRDRELSG